MVSGILEKVQKHLNLDLKSYFTVGLAILLLFSLSSYLLSIALKAVGFWKSLKPTFFHAIPRGLVMARALAYEGCLLLRILSII